ncbi:hypothetical protein JZ751_016994 [Albula glossodonta]|uniref:RNA helicase n=1 Tax=Albula glossodonta TaxID=121402 RepID=A0A8T2N285_9TELE|nr:hypothetical protein JZ751_016994 [Albula glossodonta]
MRFVVISHTLVEASMADVQCGSDGDDKINSEIAIEGDSGAENVEESEKETPKTFKELGVTDVLCEACEQLGWKSPTKIQVEAIPVALQGRDVIGLAETGSGKTGAFALPILQSLLSSAQRLHSLVLTPTRELAFQIAEQQEGGSSSPEAEQSETVCFTLRAAIYGAAEQQAVIVGGIDMMSQSLALAKKPHIVQKLQRAALKDPVKCAVSTKYSTRVALLLRNLGITAIPLHGQMSQNKRLGALNKFKSKSRSVLLATDDYIHRVGRTARAGRSGKSITFVTQYDVELFQRIETLIGKKLPAFPTQEEEVMMLVERVSEAQRFARIEMKEQGEQHKKRGREGDGDDTEHARLEIPALCGRREGGEEFNIKFHKRRTKRERGTSADQVMDFLIGSPFATPVGQRIEQATSSSLQSEDWGLNMEICDIINETEEGPKDAVRAIKKRIVGNKNFREVMLALTFIEGVLVRAILPKNNPPMTSRSGVTVSEATPNAAPSNQEAALTISPDQVEKLRADLEVVRGNLTVMSEMISQLQPGGAPQSDTELLQSLIEELLAVNDEFNTTFTTYHRFEEQCSEQETTEQIPVHQSGAMDDIEKWLNIDGEEELEDTEGVTSEEFDKFLESRAKAADRLPSLRASPPTSASLQPQDQSPDQIYKL